MKKMLVGLICAVNLVNVNATENIVGVTERGMDMQRIMDLIVIEKIGRTTAKQERTGQHVYFYYLKDGQNKYVAVNATDNPVIYSYLFTAYLTGAPIKVRLHPTNSWVVEAQLVN